MHDRQVAIIKNKKCYMSSDYVRKIIDTYRGRNEYDNNRYKDENFIRIDKLQNLDISKEQPVILYNRLKKRNINIENQVKKELADNFGYLNNTALKYNLLRFYSLNISNGKITKNNNKNKNRIKTGKLNNNTNLLFKSSDNDKSQIRQIQIKYSDKIRKRANTFKKTINKNILENNLYKNINGSNNKLDKKKLKNEEYFKNLLENKNNDINNKNYMIRRKKEYLDRNKIPYENIDINENEKNKENEKKRRVIIFKDGKYIKKKKPAKNKLINKK